MTWRSANPGKGTHNRGRRSPMGIVQCSLSGRVPKRARVGKECRIKYWSDNPDQVAPEGIEELLSQAEELRNGDIERRMN